MPDGFALAALSHAMRTRVRQVISDTADVQQTGQFDIVSKAPDQLATANPAKATLTIYPWRFIANPSWASCRQAAYSASGERRDSPLLALDVLFLLGAYAKDNAEAEAVLGLALLALHETPQLSRDLLQAMAGATFPNGSPLPQALRDLAGQPAPITVEPMNYELEDLAHVWSMFNSGVRSGMVYRVGTLLIESRRKAATGLPVREGRLSVTLLRAPTIVRVLFATATGQPFSERAVGAPGEVLRLIGSGLRGEITHIALGARLVPADEARLRDDSLEIDLPADLRPGLITLQIVQDWKKPAGKRPPTAAGSIPGERSNLLPVAIRPVLRTNNPLTIGNRQVQASGLVSFDVTPHFNVKVGARQRCELMLNAVAADSSGRFNSFTFAAPVPDPATPDTDVQVRVIPILGVPAGNYLARVIVDGAESALRENNAGVTGPLLAVPA
jgi:hypothetical protein